MAKSIIRQLLNMTGFQLPNPEGHYDPSVYRDESSAKAKPASTTSSARTRETLTGVEKYLAQKNPAPKESSDKAPELTGVAKYLAQKEQAEQKKIQAEAEKLANMTGVEKYLAQLEGGRKTTGKQTPVKKTVKAPTAKKPLTGVDKYLAKQTSTVQTSTAPAKAVKPAPPHAEVKTEPQNKPPAAKSTGEEKHPAPQQPAAPQITEPAASAEKPEEPAPKTQKADKIINLAESATQCQAATQKGSQCRRKSNLETIDQTIDQQAYRFAVCSQHNNNDFTPFAKLLS